MTVRGSFFTREGLYCCHQGDWNHLAIGTRELQDRTFVLLIVTPSLKFTYVSFSLHFSLSTLLSLLNITELGLGDDLGSSNG